MNMHRTTLLLAGFLLQAASSYGDPLANSNYSLQIPTDAKPAGLTDEESDNFYNITVSCPTSIDPSAVVPVLTLKPNFVVLFIPATSPTGPENPVYERNSQLDFLAPNDSVLCKNRTYQVPKSILQPLLNDDNPSFGRNSWRGMIKKKVNMNDLDPRTWWVTPLTGVFPDDSTVIDTNSNGTNFPFHVADQKYLLSPASATVAGRTVTWTYYTGADVPFSFEASLTLPNSTVADKDRNPQITYKLTPKAVTTPAPGYNGGFYSVAFVGAPVTTKSDRLVPQDVLGTADTYLNHVVSEQILKIPRSRSRADPTRTTIAGVPRSWSIPRAACSAIPAPPPPG